MLRFYENNYDGFYVWDRDITQQVPNSYLATILGITLINKDCNNQKVQERKKVLQILVLASAY